jgi:tagatose-1,6-bisphosphate aldolase non-catalytic subunit AgaZ/GatZ
LKRSTNNDVVKKGNPQNLPLVEYILGRMASLRKKTGTGRTLFAACPNSRSVIRAAIRSAKRCNAPIKFAATLNQVDTDRGYTGLTQNEFVKLIKQEAQIIHYTGPIMIAIDHGGPWLKDAHKNAGMPYQETMNLVKQSMIEALVAGYNLLHVDPTVDITLKEGEIIDIKMVVERTIEIITHVETYRRKHNIAKISYEVGTEEVHGGLADMATFREFLNMLKKGLEENGLSDVWPCFVVGKVGTDLHTTTFDPEMAKQLTKEARQFGSVIKGHYSDSVSNPEAYPLAEMGGANVGPEFTENEYDGLMELVELELQYHADGKIPQLSNFKAILWQAVIDSGRWIKWLQADEDENNFDGIAEDRKLWLIKTGCRYIWENPQVVAARIRLTENLENNGIDAESIVLMPIEKSMEKYFYNFNLVDLNDEL